jgi:hypothetical protein
VKNDWWFYEDRQSRVTCYWRPILSVRHDLAYLGLRQVELYDIILSGFKPGIQWHLDIRSWSARLFQEFAQFQPQRRPNKLDPGIQAGLTDTQHDQEFTAAEALSLFRVGGFTHDDPLPGSSTRSAARATALRMR